MGNGTDDRRQPDGRTVEQLATSLRGIADRAPAHWTGATLRVFAEQLGMVASEGNKTRISAALRMIGFELDRQSEQDEFYREKSELTQTESQNNVRIRQAMRDTGLKAEPLTVSRATSAPSKQSEKINRTWAHPTGRIPRTVLVVGLGPTKHNLLEMQTSHDAPWWGVDEVWGLNGGGVNWINGRVRWDLLWILDYLDGEAAKYTEYPKRIREYARRHGPNAHIMTTKAGQFSDVALEYPLQEIDEQVRSVTNAPPYFRNSLPLILAYAWFLAVEKLYLFGVDYNHPSLGPVREEHRANCEYWVGFLRASGVEVVVPDTTTLLCTNEPFFVYGYPPGPDRHPRFDGEKVHIMVDLDAQTENS